MEVCANVGCCDEGCKLGATDAGLALGLVVGDIVGTPLGCSNGVGAAVGLHDPQLHSDWPLEYKFPQSPLSKAPSPIWVPRGMLIVVSGHSKKASRPIVCKESGSVTAKSCVQPKKAKSPMSVTALLIVTETSPLQLLNELTVTSTLDVTWTWPKASGWTAQASTV